MTRAASHAEARIRLSYLFEDVTGVELRGHAPEIFPRDDARFAAPHIGELDHIQNADVSVDVSQGRDLSINAPLHLKRGRGFRTLRVNEMIRVVL